MERLKSSLGLMVIHIWARLAPRSIVSGSALPLEAKAPQSHMENRRMWDYRRGVPDPPSTSHTLNMHIFLMKPQIRSPPPSIPPLPAPIQRHSAAWQHFFIGGQKHFIVFLPFRCLKVSASEGRKDRLAYQSICVCVGPHAQTHTGYGRNKRTHFVHISW